MLTDVLKKGFIFSFILIVCIALLSGVLTANMPDSRPYLLALSLLLLTLFLLECTKTYYRVIEKNEVYAKIEITYAVILLIAVIPACSFFGVWGYLGALVFTPLLIALYYLPKNISYDSTTKRLQKGFWRYSFFTGLSNSVTQLLAVVDIILIGYLLQDPGQVTLYKYLTLIPMSLVLLPNAFLMTDFVSLTAKIKDKKYIAHYIKQYISFFLFIILGIWTIHFLFIEHILNFFGREFTSYKKLYYFLLLGISAVILIRILFGNLISALGRAKVNLWIAGFSVILNFFLNLYFIPKKGILGAAITSSVTMWVSSLLSMFCYYYFLKKPSE
jgi:O-antigen/teichoic acid export membrane protein